MWAPSSSRLTLASTASRNERGGPYVQDDVLFGSRGCGSITRRRAVRVSRSSCVFLAFRAASLQVALGLWTDRAGAHALASALRAGPACLPASEYRSSYAAKRAMHGSKRPASWSSRDATSLGSTVTEMCAEVPAHHAFTLFARNRAVDETLRDGTPARTVSSSAARALSQREDPRRPTNGPPTRFSPFAARVPQRRKTDKECMAVFCRAQTGAVAAVCL